jgi:hypothetical protein
VVLLGGAGIAKIIRPGDTTNALRAAGAHVNRGAVRAGATAEVGLAILALVFPGPVTGGLVALVYVAFAVFVLVGRRRGWALASCGCFGRPDTPPTTAHAVLNVGAAAAAVWWAAAWPGDYGVNQLGRLFFHEPWHGSALSLVTLIVAGMAYLVWTNPVPAERQ